MSKRNPIIDRVKCAEDGCREYANYHYDSRADYKDGLEWRRKIPFRCARHSRPEDVLSPQNLTRETVLEAKESPHEILKGKLFWNGSSGYSRGPGFKAFAEDFPPGTRLIITARIELPSKNPEDFLCPICDHRGYTGGECPGCGINSGAAN